MTASAHADTCDGTEQALATIAAARTALVALPEGEYPDPDLPESAQREIERVKDGVATLIDAQMRCAAGTDDAIAIGQRLRDALQPLPPAEDGDDAYAATPEVEVKAWPPHRIGIVATLPVVCGSDAMLFVYEAEDAAWQRRIDWRSAPYDKVSGAFWAFDYRLSPPDEDGRWYVLTKSIKPWCSSTWSDVTYAALRPAADAAQVVHRGADPIWWGSEDFGEIVAEPGEFDVRFHSYSIDSGVHNRVWIRRYAIDGDTVRRVQPVATTARDFVDEWIRTDWTQASAWTASDAGLQQWHARLRGDGRPHYDFAGAHACEGDDRRVQIAIAADEDARYYVDVTGTDAFTLTGVSTDADPRCGGEDLLESMATQ